MSYSSSSTYGHEWTYDVFMSFRGEDTRKKLTSHLLERFAENGINVFRDDVQVGMGQEISQALVTAIEESRLFIVVFSKNYAQSTWCLDELVKILDCKKRKNRLILPVFYEVQPTEVRRQQSGSFKEAMAVHQSTSNKNKVETWKLGLQEITSFAGIDYRMKLPLSNQSSTPLKTAWKSPRLISPVLIRGRSGRSRTS
ncbi:TIR-NBS resistance protein [Quillaja saponaria]|uniref:ADP-ribosyl cyclase/cyclic ADP-ribose hydrolase n=1 Tax=Quillaja saponaria TaxID=32244 RepID=A0AAD7Q3F3_QUISA|nr:TIR-NBS resistance protein [Quillaja saponaria]